MTGLDVSEREAEVLTAVAEHLTNAQIAARLHISIRTVESHVASLLRKFGVPDRRALTATAHSIGVDHPDGGLGKLGVLVGAPAAWTRFVGRERELDVVAAALSEARLVTLLGPGGAGKTRLAAQAAQVVAGANPLGGAFVELVSVSPGFLVQAVASLVGVTEQAQQSLVDGLMVHFRRGRSLLVLDNCEHLLDDAADLVEALLTAAPELTVLATSRERLGLPAERVVPVLGLSLKADEAGSDAAALFLDRARALDPAFAADPSVVAAICAQLDGMPLAIELAAARSTSLGASNLMAGLDDRLRLLTGGRSGDERHRSLRAVIDWSHDLLDDDERRLFRRLGVFAGGFDLASAAAVTGESNTSVLVDLIGRLVDKSLLVHRPASGGSRWAQLETVRAYALDQTATAGEAPANRERHLSWALRLAGDLVLRVRAGEAWRGDFDAVVDDLRSALVAARGEAAVRAYELAFALGHLTFTRGFLSEAREHFITAAGMAPDAAAEAAALREAGYVAQVEMRGEISFELGLAWAERAAAAGDDRSRVIALAENVVIANRFPAMFETDVPVQRLIELADEAERHAPAGDDLVEAHLVTARAWNRQRSPMPLDQRWDDVIEAARRSGDPVLISAAMDLTDGTTKRAGRLRESYQVTRRRVELLDQLPTHEPRCRQERDDILHMATEGANLVGDLDAALAYADRFADDSVGAFPLMRASKPLLALALQGRFDETMAKAVTLRRLWLDAGRPPARWMAPQVYAVALTCGLRGDAGGFADWSTYSRDLAGSPTPAVHITLTGFALFADLRIAMHTGRFDDASALIAAAGLPTEADSWWRTRHEHLDAYAWGIAAELALQADLPGAADRVRAAEPTAEQNDWVAASLTRARARLSGERAGALEAVARWEHIGARFERACTLLLLDDRADEGRAELDTLGCPPPVEA